MVAMGMRKQNGIGRGAIVEKTRHSRQNAFGQQLDDALAFQSLRVKGFTIGMDQRNSDVNDDPAGIGAQFDAVTTNRASPPMNGQSHR